MLTVEILERHDPQGATFAAHNQLKRKAEKNRPENDFASGCF
jgi:hypothetical protein